MFTTKSSHKDAFGCTRRIGDVVRKFDEDGLTIEKKTPREVSMSITARKALSLDALLSIDEDEEDEAAVEREYITSLAFDSALSILGARRFSEYTPDTIRFQGASQSSLKAAARRRALGGASGGGECAAIVMKSLGTRWGVQPLKTSYEEDMGGSSRAVAFHSMKGGHFDGEIRFSIERKVAVDDDDDDVDEDGVIVSVSLCVPRKGCKMKKKLAKKLVTALASSIATSATSEARKTVARQKQSKSYQDKIAGFAGERRAERALQNEKLEDMAADRKRKWRRKGSGSYRPSGMRLEGGPRFGS